MNIMILCFKCGSLPSFAFDMGLTRKLTMKSAWFKPVSKWDFTERHVLNRLVHNNITVIYLLIILNRFFLVYILPTTNSLDQTEKFSRGSACKIICE